jgi:NADPH-dependent 2,4-dienoyl-CoA reductase/sulfur reductase-like enzyme
VPTSPSDPFAANENGADRAPRLFDVAVVGAGPAGIAAANAAAADGATVVVVDAEQRSGGQYWRHGPQGVGRHHHDTGSWSDLVATLSRGVRAGLVELCAAHRVWRVDAPDGDRPAIVHAVRSTPDGEAPVTVRARVLVLAAGAHDRVLPFPGWDLPGVLTAGGAQALLKEHGVPAGRRAP